MKLRADQRRAIVTVAIIFSVLASAVMVLILVFVAIVRHSYSDRIHTIEKTERTIYGVVLGASIDPGAGTPSQVLQDRLDTAIELLQQRRIMGVIVTGDDGSWRSDERSAMVNYLRKHNVPDEIIVVDDPAFRTYDSCANIKRKGFNHVVLITQRFHLPRALYLCNELGIESHGVVADKRWYGRFIYNWVRDLAASPFAYLDVRGMTLIKKGPPGGV